MSVTKARLEEINEALQSERDFYRRENETLLMQNRRLTEHLRQVLALLEPYQKLADYVGTLRQEASSAGRQIEQMSVRYEQLTAYVESLRGWIGKRRRVPAQGGMRSGTASELRPWSP